MKSFFKASAAIMLLFIIIPLPASAAAFRGEEIHVGDVIELGRYPQKKNEKESGSPVSWQILAIREGEALLLSEYCLDNVPWHMTDEDISWEDCSLRSWLNTVFLEKAFAEEKDRNLLLERTQKNQANSAFETPGGEDTQDRIFLLSEEEVREYLPTKNSRKGHVTEWAKEQGAYEHEDFETSFWWLRTPGENKNEAMCIGAEGSYMLSGYLVQETDTAVRPAVWIRVDES